MDVVVWVPIILASIGAFVALAEYGVKVAAERRLQESAASEIDTRMSKLFVELMWLAEGRSGSQVSEKCVEWLFNNGVITEEDFREVKKGVITGENWREVKNLEAKLGACVVNYPVGKATQDAAIVAVAVVGGRYCRILGKPAREALNGLKAFKGAEAEKALTLLDEEERKAKAAWVVRVVRDVVHCMVGDRS
jgi:hypothetical protein